MRWGEPSPVNVPQDLREAVGGHPLVAETLVRRGYATVEAVRAFLDPAAYTPTAPEALPGMVDAVDRIEQALARRELICVWGDFDVDGQTATTVLVSMLRDLGGSVIYHIPVRETESHGVRRPWLDQELEKGVRLLITCDTGIDAADAIAYARAQGVDTVVTDHHELPQVLPEATALVNPHLLPQGHPLSTLPGVGVAYKLAEALYIRAGRPNRSNDLLDLVALGIVADVAVQTGDTRYLLQRGLRVLRRTQRLGLQILMRVAGVMPSQATPVPMKREAHAVYEVPVLDEETIGFVLGPRLNAIGRLDDANSVVELLTTTDPEIAWRLASQLESLNAKRKRICDQVFAAAEARLERDPSLLERAALVLADPTWPAGIIGIVANRLAEAYRRPTVLLSAPPGELARGSARSVPGCHITEAIATQAALLEHYGGHEMAAGLAIEPERIDSFYRGLDSAVARQMPAGPAAPEVEIHGCIPLGELTMSLVLDLQRLAPFGPGNPPLVLAMEAVAVTGRRMLGREQRHLRLTVEDRNGVERQVVWWNWRGAVIPDGRVDIAFRARVQEYRGEVEVQLVWEAMRPAASAPMPVPGPGAGFAFEILDYRKCAAPEKVLATLQETYPATMIWVEGPAREMVNGHHRFMLDRSDTLVIWGCPPGVDVLQSVLRRVAPLRVVLAGCEAPAERPKDLLIQLLGMVKYAILNKNGRVDPAELAAVLGHREVAVRKGLDLLAALGKIELRRADDLVLRVASGSSAEPDRVAALEAAWVGILNETAAYRRYFWSAPKERLLAGLSTDEEA